MEWHKGEQIERIGPSDEAGFDFATILTGHEKGKQIYVATAQHVNESADKWREEWQQQQSEFRRLHKRLD